ncbi:MAG: hypothetical protein AABX02_02970 [archaeon]
MKSKTMSKSKQVSKKEVKDPLWEEIKAGFDSLKRGKATEWKYPFK